MNHLAVASDNYGGACELASFDEFPGHDLVDLPEFAGGHANLGRRGKGEAVLGLGRKGIIEKERAEEATDHGQEGQLLLLRQEGTSF
jgi:hypothetical protein